MLLVTVLLGWEMNEHTPHRSLNRCCLLIRVKMWLNVFFSFLCVLWIGDCLFGLLPAQLPLTAASELGPGVLSVYGMEVPGLGELPRVTHIHSGLGPRSDTYMVDWAGV